MRSKDGHPLDGGAAGFDKRLPATWQEWALIGIFMGFLTATQVFILRLSPAYYPVFGVGAAFLLVIYVRKTRLGRRWLEWLRVALADAPVGGRRARQTGRYRRTRR